jgi:septum formation topological specificity factor MinE
MNTEAIDKFVKSLISKSYALSKDKEVQYQIILIKDGQEKSFLPAGDKEVLTRIKDGVNLINADKVKVELLYDERKETHELNLNEELGKLALSPQAEMGQIGFWPSPQMGFVDSKTEINNQVQMLLKQELEKERTLRDLEDLKEKLIDKTKKLESLEKQIESQTQSHQKEVHDLKADIKVKQEEIERLEKVISDKKNFKYYAGLTGDILQSFGIKKEVIAKPLAGLLAGSDEEENKAIEQTASPDTSGIVDEEDFNEQPNAKSRRQEMIDLLCMYLENLDTLTIEKLFAIFSEIETDKALADKLILFISQNKSDN